MEPRRYCSWALSVWSGQKPFMPLAPEFRLTRRVAFARTGPCRFSISEFSGRLYAGFGALVLFCAGLAALGVWQLGEIHDQVRSLTVQSTNTIRASEIATELQAGRRAILRYAFDMMRTRLRKPRSG